MKKELLKKLKEIDQDKGRQWMLDKTGTHRSYFSGILNEKKKVSAERLFDLIEKCGFKIILKFEKRPK